MHEYNHKLLFLNLNGPFYDNEPFLYIFNKPYRFFLIYRQIHFLIFYLDFCTF